MAQATPKAKFSRKSTGGIYGRVSPWLSLPIYVFFIALVIVPVIFVVLYALTKTSGMVLGAEGFGIDHFERVLTNPIYLNVIGRSLRIGVIATIVTVVISYLPS